MNGDAVGGKAFRVNVGDRPGQAACGTVAAAVDGTAYPADSLRQDKPGCQDIGKIAELELREPAGYPDADNPADDSAPNVRPMPPIISPGCWT